MAAAPAEEEPAREPQVGGGVGGGTDGGEAESSVGSGDGGGVGGGVGGGALQLHRKSLQSRFLCYSMGASEGAAEHWEPRGYADAIGGGGEIDDDELSSDDEREDWMPPRRPPRGFRRVVRWQLDELSLLLGSDTVVFRSDERGNACSLDGSNSSHGYHSPGFSVGLHEANSAATSMVCLDYWLDNMRVPTAESERRPARIYLAPGCRSCPLHPRLSCFHVSALSPRNRRITTTPPPPQVMFNAHSTALCLHKEGVVQGYRVVPTSELPTGCGIGQGFSPSAVTACAVSVLRFLRQHCTREAGTYWLTRPNGGDELQLFDITDWPGGDAAEEERGEGDAALEANAAESAAETAFTPSSPTGGGVGVGSRSARSSAEVSRTTSS